MINFVTDLETWMFASDLHLINILAWELLFLSPYLYRNISTDTDTRFSALSHGDADATSAERSIVPSVQRSSSGNGGSQVRLSPHVCRPDGTGNRPSPAQLKPTKSPTLYTSLMGCTVMPSGRSGGRHTLPGTPEETAGWSFGSRLLNGWDWTVGEWPHLEQTYEDILLGAGSTLHQGGSWWTGNLPGRTQRSTGTPHPLRKGNMALLSGRFVEKEQGLWDYWALAGKLYVCCFTFPMS